MHKPLVALLCVALSSLVVFAAVEIIFCNLLMVSHWSSTFSAANWTSQRPKSFQLAFRIGKSSSDERTHEGGVGLQGRKLGLSISSLGLDFSGLGCVVVGDFVELGRVGRNSDKLSITLDLVALSLDWLGTIGSLDTVLLVALGGSGDGGGEEESNEEAGELHVGGWWEEEDWNKFNKMKKWYKNSKTDRPRKIEDRKDGKLERWSSWWWWDERWVGGQDALLYTIYLPWTRSKNARISLSTIRYFLLVSSSCALFGNQW